VKPPDDAAPQPSTPPAGAIPEERGAESRLARTHTRTPRLHRVCDGLTETLIYGMVIFTPWALGTTWLWAIWTMNVTAYVLGLLLFLKWFVRGRTGYQPERWGEATSPDADSPGQRRFAPERALPFAMAGLTVSVLAYCLISALNARATFLLEEDRFEYHKFIPWLPHSYDGPRTWFAFWTYLGLAFFFWALRDWLLSMARRERHSQRQLPEDTPCVLGAALPVRLRRLLWILCSSGALLALEGTLQRLDGTNKLLWLVEPYWNKTAEAQFGPYAYRSNAAQYLNLLWPVCLGFWWTLRQTKPRAAGHTIRVGSGAELLLVPCAVLMAAGPIISSSRGGAAVAGGMAVLVSCFLLDLRRRKHRMPWGIIPVFTGVLALGATLGWPALKKRFTAPPIVHLSGLRIGTNIFSLHLSFPCPSTNPALNKVLAAMSGDTTWPFAPWSFVASVETDGSLQARLTGASNADIIQKKVTNLVRDYGGQLVRMTVVREADLLIYLNGREVRSQESSWGTPVFWRDFVVSTYLWYGRSNSISPNLDVPAYTIRLFNCSLTSAQIGELQPRGAVKIPDLPNPSLDFEPRSDYDVFGQWAKHWLSSRSEINENSRQIALDFPWLGVGASAYGAVYQLYRRDPRQSWAAYAHDDWLETRITFGRIGFVLILLMLLLVPLNWLLGSRIHAPGIFVSFVGLALAGCLIHARFDFPFQVYSVLFLFLLLCSTLTCLSKKS